MKHIANQQRSILRTGNLMNLPLWNAFGIKELEMTFNDCSVEPEKITKRELAEDRLNQDFKRTLEAESEVAKMLTQRIVDRDLQLKPIRQFQRWMG